MTHFLIKMIFYTSGVVGILLIAYVVAKNFLSGGMLLQKKKGNLEIEESLAISPRKTLHIVKAFNEKFLVASDATSTTLLAKLNTNGEIEPGEIQEEFSTLLEQKDEQSLKSQKPLRTGSVIHSMLEKLNN